VGRSGHPHLQRPVGAGLQEPAGRASRPASRDPDHPGPPGSPRRRAWRPGARLRDAGGAVRKAAPPAAPARAAGRDRPEAELPWVW